MLNTPRFISVQMYI